LWWAFKGVVIAFAGQSAVYYFNAFSFISVLILCDDGDAEYDSEKTLA
jgi:hypothetical protein